MAERSRVTLAYGLGGAALALLPVIGQYGMGIAAEVMVFAVFAMSLDLLIGFTGLLSFGHAAFFGVGAYTVATLGVHFGVNGWGGMLVAVVVSSIVALVIGFFSIRVSGVPFLMLTLAFSQLLFSIAIKWRDFTGGTDGLNGFVRPSLFGWSLDQRIALYYVVLTGFLLAFVFLQRLIRSPLGSVFIGIRDNELRMRALGYPVQRFKLIAFVIAGAVAGFGGALYAFLNAYVSTDILNWSLSGDGIIMVILGGAGTIVGPVIGSVVFLLLKNVLSSHFDFWSIWIGVAFILSVMFLRAGVWGTFLRAVPSFGKKA